MAGWIVRYREHELPLPEGTHLVGRGKECIIRLDDNLVSRRHAALVVTVDGVLLRDLGSRNGVFLKYRRLNTQEEVRLFHGDTFLVGQTNLVLLRERGRGKTRTLEAAIGKSKEGSGPMPATRFGVPYHKFLAEADRSLAEGDMDRYAGATHLLLETLTSMLEHGFSDEAVLTAASRHAIELAELRGIEWVDQLLGLYEAGPLILSIESVTALQRLFAERGWRSERLERYVELVRPLLDDAGPRGRALLSQLDSLVRHRA